jgi:hypothetical protein
MTKEVQYGNGELTLLGKSTKTLATRPTMQDVNVDIIIAAAHSSM